MESRGVPIKYKLQTKCFTGVNQEVCMCMHVCLGGGGGGSSIKSWLLQKNSLAILSGGGGGVKGSFPH